MMNACGFERAAAATRSVRCVGVCRPRARTRRRVSATIRSTVKRSLHAGETRRSPIVDGACRRVRSCQQPRRSPSRHAPRGSRGRHEQPGHARRSTTSGMPPARVATIGLRAGHRVEERRAEPFGDRAHHEQVEPLDAAEDVGAEARQQHVLLEVVLVDLPLEVLAQLALAEDDEARVGHLAARRGAPRRSGSAGPCAARARRRCRRAGAWCGSQNASCTFTAGAACDVLDVDALVHRDRCARPACRRR